MLLPSGFFYERTLSMIRTAIIGASGYTGAEAMEIFLRHPGAELTYLTALPEECGQVADLFGQFRGRLDMQVEPLDLDKLSRSADVALCCLPHKVSMGFVPKLLDAGVRVIDFSADYRIRDVKVYEKYYQPHTDPKNLAHAVYGLPELYRERIPSARLIANPGCFPTGLLLAIAPLLKKGLIETHGIIDSAVTGVSGGGKNPSVTFHYPNMNENILPYGVGTHRHMPEMEQIASETAGKPVEVIFQPHVAAFDRGILSSVYAAATETLTGAQLHELFKDFYKNEPFVQVLSKPPALKQVAKTNYCHLFPTVVKGRVVVFSAIDNLIKGASGQAVQNLNLMFGLPETMGLE